MTTHNGSESNRLERRKARTRAALVGAAQSLPAEGQDQRADPRGHPGRRRRHGIVLHRLHPTLSKVLLNDGLSLANSRRGLAPRARRDIEAAAEAGRFDIRDPELSMTIVAGAAPCVGRLPHDHPERDDAEAADQVAEDLLRMFGLSSEEAHEICRRPLPPLTCRVGSNP